MAIFSQILSFFTYSIEIIKHETVIASLNKSKYNYSSGLTGSVKLIVLKTTREPVLSKGTSSIIAMVE
jgi:hypothetical protein